VPITPYDCFERLIDAIAESEGTVNGDVSLEGFLLSSPARFGVAARPVLSGVFKPEPAGTEVRYLFGEVGAGWLSVPLLLGAWLTLWALWLIALLLWLSGELALWQIALLGMTNVVAGLLLWWWLRRRSAPADLAKFLEAALARPGATQNERSESSMP
jgi:hypothetical protein